MSGGYFNYDQYKIRYIWEKIQNLLDKQGTEKPKEDLYSLKNYYEKYPEDKLYKTYPSEIQKIFKEAIEILQKAEIYIHRIDLYLSEDHGNESFLCELIEDLNKLNNK